jgi:hypothetical protein
MHRPFEHVIPDPQEQEPPQPSPPQVPGAHEGVQQVWLARHRAPVAQEQEPPQPSPPQVPGAHEGVQQVWSARHRAPVAQEQEPPQPSPPQVPGAHEGVQGFPSSVGLHDDSAIRATAVATPVMTWEDMAFFVSLTWRSRGSKEGSLVSAEPWVAHACNREHDGATM